MTWILTIASLIGNLLNCRRMKICFLIWIACNIGWMIIDISNGVCSRALLDIVQTVFAVYGYREWKRIER